MRARKGRSVPDEIQPKSIGRRRHVRERGGFKVLNENLAPLRRYLEAQVGRPWDKIYSRSLRTCASATRFSSTSAITSRIS